MKFIYTKVLARLKQIPELKWVDLDKGQLDYYEKRPSVQFPCALIDIQVPRTEDLDTRKTKQQCQALINIRMAWDFSGNTSGATPDVELDKSLEYFSLMEKVYIHLQGFGDVNINPFSRQNVRTERRDDGYKVVNMAFVTEYNDNAVTEGEAPAPILKPIDQYTPEELEALLTAEQIAYLQGEICETPQALSTYTIEELMEGEDETDSLTFQQVIDIIGYVGSDLIYNNKPDMLTYVAWAKADESIPILISADLILYLTQNQKNALIPEICPVQERIYNYMHITGQTTEYAIGDAVWIKNNIFSGLATSGKLVRLTSFSSLAENNVFGNTNRFTDINGLQVYGDGYIIDHYTGLGWYNVRQGQSLWADAVSGALASNQNGFGDWFLPNILQMQSLLNIGNEFWAPLNYDGGSRWSSTSTDVSNAIWFQGLSYPGRRFAKSNIIYYYLCRKHF